MSSEKNETENKEQTSEFDFDLPELDGKKITIHRKPPEECEACSA